MRKITYKYNVGDTVVFKDHFYRGACSKLKKLAGSTAKVTERFYWGGKTYRLAGHIGTFKESCFVGKKEDN